MVGYCMCAILVLVFVVLILLLVLFLGLVSRLSVLAVCLVSSVSPSINQPDSESVISVNLLYRYSVSLAPSRRNLSRWRGEWGVEVEVEYCGEVSVNKAHHNIPGK